jgi:two-component system CheB/CheR fusion protein
MLVQPRSAEGGHPAQALVLFLEARPTADRKRTDAPSPDSERERVLLKTLHQAEQHIDHLHSEHHAVDEDLRAANEELQSINEELQTVNHEFRMKLDEVSRAHNDLENPMTATDIATLFLDWRLRIKRFTPKLAEVFNVKSHDRGRPMTDFTHYLEYAELERDACSPI